MRTVRAVTMLAVVLGCLFVSATPAAADATISLHGGDATYVPHITGDPGPPKLTFDVALDPANPVPVTVDVEADVGGNAFDFGPLNQNCSVSDGVNHCPVASTGSLDLTFNEADLNSLVQTAKSATVTVTATIQGGDSKTGHVNVRPQADLRVTGMHVNSSPTPSLGFTVANQGPSGSASTRIVVTGFRTQPPDALPAGCVWSARVTVTCTRQGQPTVDDSGPLQLPVLPAQAGCTYRVVVIGFYQDAHGANNTATTRGPGPCLASATLPATPSTPASPSAPPSTPASTPGSPGSSGPGGASSGPATVLAGDDSSSGSTLGKALIALSGIFLLAGLIVAYVGFRRPPGGWQNEPSTQLRR